MVHNNVQHRAALIHHGVQLRFHFRTIMTAGYLPDQAGREFLDNVATGCGGDIRSRGPQQGHVAHDDLAADREPGRQRSGADRLRRML